MTEYQKTWTSWRGLSEAERNRMVFDREFWSHLTDAQKQAFLDEADWQEIRCVPEAERVKMDSLVSLDDLCKEINLDAIQVYWLMSTRKLAGGYLVGGTWKFDRTAVLHWVETSGGLAAVRADIEAQMAKHRASQGSPSTEGD